MTTQEIQQNNLDQQLLLASQVALAEIIGEIEDAKINKRKVNVSPKAKEKSKIGFERWRIQKYKAYLGAVLLVFLSLFGSGAFFKNDTIFIAIVTFFFIFTLILRGRSELGYIRKITSDKTEDEIETYCYYVFDKVPKVRYFAIFATAGMLIVINFAIMIFFPQLIEISSMATGIILIILALFYEFIFERVEK